MKKELFNSIALLVICALGGLLVGFNAGKLSQGLNAALFTIGVVLMSMSGTLLGLFKTIWNRRRRN